MKTRSTFHYWAAWARNEADKFRGYAARAPQRETSRIQSLLNWASTCDSWAAEYAARAVAEDTRFGII